MERDKQLWFDLRGLLDKEVEEFVNILSNSSYEAVMLDVEQQEFIEKLPMRMKVLLNVNYSNNEMVREIIEKNSNRVFTVFIDQMGDKLSYEFKDVNIGAYVKVYDRESMNRCIELGQTYKNVIIEFESETNIPLELILAFSQKNKALICKKIDNAEDGWIATMTMEMGSHAVLLKTKNTEDISKLESKIKEMSIEHMDIQELKVKEIKHIGMGDRICIDTISRLDMDEGMIIGSTSSGGVLVSSETHYLPYMDLRPFRVNAGAIHSYVICPNDTTKYLSELKAGDEVIVVNSKGVSRRVSVGRVKIEKRPMLLIRAESNEGVEVNTIVQDDWHIRIISEGGGVKNSVLLRTGDIVLGYTMESGRHLGVKIDETIIEK